MFQHSLGGVEIVISLQHIISRPKYRPFSKQLMENRLRRASGPVRTPFPLHKLWGSFDKMARFDLRLTKYYTDGLQHRCVRIRL